MSLSHTTSTHRTPRRAPRLTLVTALAAIALLLSACLTKEQQADVDLINQARKANRKTAVTPNNQATAKAQKWSERMASTGRLEHTGGGSKVDTTGLPKWCSVGENVGYGPSVKAVHDQFMRSASHKANILGNFTHVGVGVVTKGSTVWVTEIYFRSC